MLLLFFFFFQAEDGIRDLYVTGVQTCALPISVAERGRGWREQLHGHRRAVHVLDAPLGIEGVRREGPVEGRPEEEPAPGRRIPLEPRPAVAAVSGREVRPARSEDMRMNIDGFPHGTGRQYSKGCERPSGLTAPRRED